MSSAKLAKEKVAQTGKVEVHISKETGGAYADPRDVIISELARIRNKREHKTSSNGKVCSTNTQAANINKQSR